MLRALSPKRVYMVACFFSFLFVAPPAALFEIRSVSMASDGSLIAAASHSGRIFTWRPTAAGNGGTGYVRFAAIDSGHHGYLTK